MSVYAVAGGKRTPAWETRLNNRVSPGSVHVSDFGNHVITFDNWASVGYGDDVVAIYNRTGLVAKYSLESLFNRPSDEELRAGARKLAAKRKGIHGGDYLKEHVDFLKEYNKQRGYFRERFMHTTSSRWWQQHSFGFFDGPHYCLWVDWESRWIAWNLETGKVDSVQPNQTKRWNERARWRVLSCIKEKGLTSSDIRYFGNVKDPKDKSLIEEQLKHASFSTGFSSRTGNTVPAVYVYYSESDQRKTADQILVDWNHPPSDAERKRRRLEYEYRFLGSLNLSVTFPTAPKKGEGNLVVYLLEKGAKLDAVPVHFIAAALEYSYPYNFRNQGDAHLEKNVNFSIRGVTPGRYDIHAIWDKVPPLNGEKPPFASTKGDWVADKPVEVDIKAGKVISDVSVNCTKRVR